MFTFLYFYLVTERSVPFSCLFLYILPHTPKGVRYLRPPNALLGEFCQFSYNGDGGTWPLLTYFEKAKTAPFWNYNIRTTLLLTLTPYERFLFCILSLWGLVGIHVLRKHKIQNDGNYEYNSHTKLIPITIGLVLYSFSFSPVFFCPFQQKWFYYSSCNIDMFFCRFFLIFLV